MNKLKGKLTRKVIQLKHQEEILKASGTRSVEFKKKKFIQLSDIQLSHLAPHFHKVCIRGTVNNRIWRKLNGKSAQM